MRGPFHGYLSLEFADAKLAERIHDPRGQILHELELKVDS